MSITPAFALVSQRAIALGSNKHSFLHADELLYSRSEVRLAEARNVCTLDGMAASGRWRDGWSGDLDELGTLINEQANVALACSDRGQMGDELGRGGAQDDEEEGEQADLRHYC